MQGVDTREANATWPDLVDQAAGLDDTAIAEQTARHLDLFASPQAELDLVAPALPIWVPELRGVPNALVRGALFNAAKTTKDSRREYFHNKQVRTPNGTKIEYRGEELRQDDLSVFMTILHFGRHVSLGQPIYFSAYQMLKELGWSLNKAEYAHLRDCCGRLSATNVSVTHTNGFEGYAGSLVRGFAWKDNRDEMLSRWYVLLEPAIVSLFADNTYTLLEWAERKEIGGRSPLALWLHSFLATHKPPKPLSVRHYYELSQSRAVSFTDFRRRLKQALARLVEIGFLRSYALVDDCVHVERTPKSYQRPLLPGAAPAAVPDDDLAD